MKEVLPGKSKQKSKEWMNEDILHLMDQRRVKKDEPEEYAKIEGEIRKACRSAKEQWFVERCEEMEDLQR